MKPIRWAHEEGHGLEHLTWSAREDGVVVDSVVIGEDLGRAYGIRYRLRCAPDWSLREAKVEVAGGAVIAVVADGLGHWRDASGRPVEALAGCIDIDISATPFTNTLPIRRLGLAAGERRAIRVAYLAIPTAALGAADQAYTCLEPNRRYRFESLSDDFRADLDVDEDGLVLDYPTLFRRLSPSAPRTPGPPSTGAPRGRLT